MNRTAAILAVIVLFVNDHVFKHAYPGWITGKLSDAAGMIFFPLLLADLVTWFRPTWRVVVGACVATAVVFAAVKTLPCANEAYRIVWGVLRAPLALATGHRPFVRVVLVRDPTDLLVLPLVLLALVCFHPGRCAAFFRFSRSSA